MDPLDPIDRIDPLEAILSSDPSRQDRDEAESLAVFTTPL